MKDFLNLKKSRWLLLSLLALLMGAGPAWAQKELPYSYGFEDYNLAADGWTTQNPSGLNSGEFAIAGAAKKTGSYGFRFSSYNSRGDNTQYLISPELMAPNGLDLTFAYAASSTNGTETFKVGYSTTDTNVESFTWGDEISYNRTAWTTYEGSFPAGTKYVAIYYYANYQYRLFVDDFSFVGKTAGPALQLYDGLTKITTGYACSFGLVSANAEKTFSVTNPGTEPLTVNISTTGGFTATPASMTIGANGSETLTVVAPDASGNGTVTVTPTAGGIDPVTINLSCTIKDPTKVFVDFADGKLPEGWTEKGYTYSSYGYNTTYNWKYTAGTPGYASFESGSYTGELISPVLNIEEGEKIFVDYARYNTSSFSTAVLKVETSIDGTNWVKAGEISSSDAVYGTWKTLEATAPAAAHYMRITGGYINITNIYGGSLPNEPLLTFSAADYDFGAITQDTQSTEFVISNSGAATLTGLSITSNSDVFVISEYPTTIAGGGKVRFTVTMKAGNIGICNGVITVSADGFTGDAAVTFNVSGCGLDENADVVDFNSAIPGTWENQDNGWSIQNGAAKCTGKKNLTTPKLDFSASASPFFVFKVKASDSGSTDYVTVEGSADNGSTWTAFELKKYTYDDGDFGSSSADYTTIVVPIPSTVNRLRFNGYYVLIDEIIGLQYAADDPRLGVYSDAACTTAFTGQGAEANFGFIAEEQNAKFYFRNDGTGTLNLSVGEIMDEGFTAVLDKSNLGKDEIGTLTVTMSVAKKGYKYAKIVVDAGELGVFTVSASGVARDGNKLYVDFSAEGAKFPAGWTQGNWTITSGAASASGEMQTGKLIASAGESLIVEAISKASYWSSAVLSYSYSRDNGVTWSEATSIAEQLTTDDYTIVSLGDIAPSENDSAVIVKFNGSNAAIRRIYGFVQPSEPIMTTNAADYNFGMQTAEAVKEFTVKNEGLADLTNLTAVLKTGTDYTVAVGKTTLAPNEETTITVTQKFSLDNLGAHSDSLTISADEQESVAIALSGKTRDGSKLFVDFDNEGFPENWTFSITWNTGTQNGNKYAYKYGNATFVTAPLTVGENEVMTFQTGWYSGTGSLKIRYSVDGGVNWSEYQDFSDLVQTTDWKDVTLTGIPAGKVILEFKCSGIKLDNISGFGANAEMPVVALTKGGTEIIKENGSFPAVKFGTINEPATAVYTLKNNGTADLVSTVATTGDVTAAITGEGEGVTINENKVTVAAGKSATITVTMPVVAPFGEKAGQMTITSEDGVGEIAIDFSGTTVNPASLYVDFADGAWPAGWYHSSEWSVNSSKYVYNYSGTEADFITQKLHVAGAEDALAFSAWNYSSSYASTFKLYYSTDRQNWTEYAYDTELSYSEHKTITVKGLEEGDYYLKFTGSRLCIDDFAGWTKVAVARDLYVTASNIPTTPVVPGNNITATVTVTSLIAAEAGVYAKLFFGEDEVATATAADVALNASKTFSMTGVVPAVEGVYDATIAVYYGDGTLAYTSAATQVELAHTRTLSVTAFARVKAEEEPDTLTANAANQFAATFSVKVKNTGSTVCQPVVKVFLGEAEVASLASDKDLAAGSDSLFTIVAENIPAGEGGSLSFTAKTFWGEAEFAYATPVAIVVTAAAPKFGLAVKDGAAVVDGTAVSFGWVAEAVTKTYTISNSGNRELVLKSIVAPDGFEATALTDENKTIAIGGSLDIDVTMTNVVGKKSGNLSITYQVDANTDNTFTLALSGNVLDPEKMFEDFAGNELPAEWTTQGIGSYTSSSSYAWNFSSGYATYRYSYSTESYLPNYQHSLITPAMNFDEGGETLMFRMKKNPQYSSYLSYLLVQYTTDGTTWTDTEEGAFENDNISSDWADAEVTIPGTAKKVRFVACGIALDDIYGGQIVPEPKMVFAKPADYSFGLISEATTTAAYTIQNTGTAAVTGLSVTSDNENFVVAVADDATSIAPKSEVTFTVTMKADVEGVQNGKITVKADGFDAVEFNVSGFVLDTNAIVVDFADNELPSGWAKSGFTISNNEASYNNFVGTLTSPGITVTEGQKMVIYARGLSTRNATLDVKTSTDNGATWSDAVKTFTTELRQNTTDYVVLTVDNIEAGNYRLKFTGDYVAIKCINGYTYNLDAPALGVTLAGAAVATGYNDNFGTKVKEAMTHTYTIKNTGTGTLTGTITSSVPEHFTVSQSEFSLAKDETLDFDLYLVFNETYEDKASVITIHPTVEGLADFVINASATTKDPDVWEEDFAGGIPEFWVNEGGAWSTSHYNHEGQAGPMSSSNKTLTTPRLQATEGQVLQFDVIDAENTTYFLKAEYSSDKSNWTEIETYTTSGTKEFVAPADGYYYLRFTGYYTYIDNFIGFKLSLPDHIVDITASNIPSSAMKETVSFNATVTLKEGRGLAEEVTAKVYMNDVEIGSETASLAANESKQITIVATPTAAAEDAEMYIEVTYAGGTLTTEKVTRTVAALVKLELAENEAKEITTGTTFDVITVKRSFVQGWNTLILPVATDIDLLGENALVFKMDEYDTANNTLKFSKVTKNLYGSSLLPATPYVVYVPEKIEELTFTYTNQSISTMWVGTDNIRTVSDGVIFQGSYDPVDSETLQGSYGLTAGGKIMKASATATMKGFRAYFVNLPANARVYMPGFEDDVVTGIRMITVDNSAPEGTYNMQGQKVEQLKKGGLYIINGKKQLSK